MKSLTQRFVSYGNITADHRQEFKENMGLLKDISSCNIYTSDIYYHVVDTTGSSLKKGTM